MGTLRVRNEAQRVLMVEELQGQFSDGWWENAAPHDHWKPWCNAEVVVDPSNVGRDFWVAKDNYAIAHKELLDVIGDRMVEYVQTKAGLPDFTMKDLRRELKDLKVIFKTRSA